MANPRKFLERDFHYTRRVDRLTEKVKYALFFARTASVTSSKSDSIETTYQLGSSLSNDLDSYSDSTNVDNQYEPSLNEDEYEDLDDSGPDVSFVLKSTKECKDDVVTKLNFSYTNPAQVKAVYGVSPMDYRLNSLRETLVQLNEIHTNNAVNP